MLCPLASRRPAAGRAIFFVVLDAQRGAVRSACERKGMRGRLHPAPRSSFLPNARAAPQRYGPGRQCPSALRPRGLRAETKSPMSFRVLSEMSTAFDLAIPCRRAARFGVSPTPPRSCTSPVPIKSPTTTKPLAMLTRVCSGTGASRAPTAAISSRPARTARSNVERSGSGNYAVAAPKFDWRIVDWEGVP